MSIVARIMEEEIYVSIKVKDAVFVEDNPEMALFKLRHLNDLLEFERLAYAEHLATLFEMIGEEAFKTISAILK
jgi:serine/threonine-protein phosphatase 4 regulatory subunit 1